MRVQFSVFHSLAEPKELHVTSIFPFGDHSILNMAPGWSNLLESSWSGFVLLMSWIPLNSFGVKSSSHFSLSSIILLGSNIFGMDLEGAFNTFWTSSSLGANNGGGICWCCEIASETALGFLQKKISQTIKKNCFFYLPLLAGVWRRGVEIIWVSSKLLVFVPLGL